MMTNKPYTIFTLSNGLRAVCRTMHGLVSYIGVAVNVGSRDEDLAHQGLAHFVEHTIFKGTRHRRSWQVSSRMEVVGGELNAYTSKEETLVYTNAPSGYEGRAMELLADLIGESVFPEEEIEKEKDVVIEEINSYLDSPSDSVYDDFEELAYSGSSLSHNILGTRESVRGLKGTDCRAFLDKFYTPGEMVVYCCTSLSDDKALKLLEKYFGFLRWPNVDRERQTPPAMSIFDERRDRGGHQANVIVGTRVFGRTDPRRYALFLLNNYLGGPCMNSRLNRELREKRGLVYTVDSSVALLSDAGLFSVYFGCDPASVDKCRGIVYDELDRIAQNLLSPVTFDRMKRQYCGQLLVSSDHIENRAMSLAKSVMYYGEVNDISVTAQRIREVSAEDLRDVAALLSPAVCGTLVLV